MTALGELVHGRSGDKEDRVTIGIRPLDSDHYPGLVEWLTPKRVKGHLGALVEGEIERTLLPELPGIVFTCHEALPGGGASVLRVDAQGKTYFQALAKMPVTEDELTFIKEANSNDGKTS